MLGLKPALRDGQSDLDMHPVCHGAKSDAWTAPPRPLGKSPGRWNPPLPSTGKSQVQLKPFRPAPVKVGVLEPVPLKPGLGVQPVPVRVRMVRGGANTGFAKRSLVCGGQVSMSVSCAGCCVDCGVFAQVKPVFCGEAVLCRGGFQTRPYGMGQCQV